MNEMNRKSWRKAMTFMNRAFSSLYLMAAAFVAYRAVSGEINLVGALAIITFFGSQAVGHYQPYWWGPKVTAAVLGAANIGLIIYLLPAYEQYLLPELHQRLPTFIWFTAITMLFVANFMICKRLFFTVRIGPDLVGVARTE